MTRPNTHSKLHSVFLVSVAMGAVGIAIADTASDGSAGYLGFLAGFVGGFIFLSILAVISDNGRTRAETGTTVVAEGQLSQQFVRAQKTTRERSAQSMVESGSKRRS